MDTRLRISAALTAVLMFATALRAENAAIGDTARAATTKGALQRAHWGILVETGEGETLYAQEPDVLVTPASSRKLFTAAFAQSCLGFTARLKTEVSTRGVVRAGTLEGDLIVRGDGDPSFGGRFDPMRTDSLLPIVLALRARGIRRITGDVVADVSLFGGDILPPDWKHGYLSDYYAAPVDALAFNENVIGVSTVDERCRSTSATVDPQFVRVRVEVSCGKARALRYHADETNNVVVTSRLLREQGRERVTDLVSVKNPALYAAQAVRDELLRGGIGSRGTAVTRTRVDGDPLLTIEGSDLSAILGVLLEDSQNLYAEMLLKRAAAESRAAPVMLEDALAAEREFHRSVLGLEPESFAFFDGSGLAPDNLVSPRALVRVARYMSEGDRGRAFLPLMAEPGDPGTLRNRLKPLKGRVFAKTGYINGVAALAGTLVRRDGGHIYFAIVANHYDVPSSQVRESIDMIVSKLAESY